MRLQGEVAAVTGGGSGLGAAIVERFVSEGARVVVLDRSVERCQSLRERHGDAIATLAGDVRSQTDNEALVDLAITRFGRLDCVVGNAGIWDYNVALVDLDADRLSEVFDELFQINVLGYMMLAKAALSPLVDSSGSMVFTVSNAGFLPAGGGVMYTASKHAVVGLIRQLAYELAPHIRVNGVAPGPISTNLGGPESLGMGKRRFPGEKIAANAADFVPLGRMATPADYAGAFVFFADRRDNLPATGTVLNHDGGFNVRGLYAVPRGGDDLLERL